MDYNYTLTYAVGSLGILGRGAAALGILLVMNYLDKGNPEYGKAVKWLIIGGIVCLLLSALLWGLFVGLMGMAFFSPMFFW